MLRQKRKPGVVWLPLAIFVFFAGCAPAYDWYPCGNVSCYYCPPNALPDSNWESCNCTDSPGQVYLANAAAERASRDAVPVAEVPVIDARSKDMEKTDESDYFLAPPVK